KRAQILELPAGRDEGVQVIIRGIGSAGDLAFVVDGVGLAEGSAQGSELFHLPVFPYETEETVRGPRGSDYDASVIDAVRAVPALLSAEGSQADHLAVAIEKGNGLVVGKVRRADNLTGIIQAIRGGGAAAEIADV